MKTVVEVTLRMTVEHPEGSLDSNSIKSTVNRGMAAMTNEGTELLTTVHDEGVESVVVQITQFKENGSRQALSLYGTEDVPWGEA